MQCLTSSSFRCLDGVLDTQSKHKSKFLKEQIKHSNEEYGTDCTVSNTKFSSVSLNELPERGYSNFEFQQYRL